LSHAGEPCPRCGETLENCWRCWECRKDLTSEQEDVEHVEQRTAVEEHADLLSKCHWDDYTLKVRLKGLRTAEEARQFAAGEAVRARREGDEKRENIIRAAEKIGDKLEAGAEIQEVSA